MLFSDWFRVTALVTLIRSSFLTWAWVYVVRRHLKEVNDIGQRPKLQTIISIATAHPFSPRPPEEILEIVASTKHQRNRKPSTSRTFESRQHASRSFDRGSSFSSNISAEYIQRVWANNNLKIHMPIKILNFFFIFEIALLGILKRWFWCQVVGGKMYFVNSRFPTHWAYWV